MATRWGTRSVTVRRHFVGSERSTALQARNVGSRSIPAISRFIRRPPGNLPRARAIWPSFGSLVRRPRRGGALPPVPMTPEARSVGLYSKSVPAPTVEPLEALRTDTALGLGGEFVTVQVEIKGPKMGQIGGAVAPLAPPEASQGSPAPHWV